MVVGCPGGRGVWADTSWCPGGIRGVSFLPSFLPSFLHSFLFWWVQGGVRLAPRSFGKGRHSKASAPSLEIAQSLWFDCQQIFSASVPAMPASGRRAHLPRVHIRSARGANALGSRLRLQSLRRMHERAAREQQTVPPVPRNADDSRFQSYRGQDGGQLGGGLLQVQRALDLRAVPHALESRVRGDVLAVPREQADARVAGPPCGEWGCGLDPGH